MKRAKRKGPFKKLLSLQTDKKVELLPRNFEITSNLIGSTFSVHSGKKIVSLTASENMVGYRVGEFVPTREKFEFKKKKKGK